MTRLLSWLLSRCWRRGWLGPHRETVMESRAAMTWWRCVDCGRSRYFGTFIPGATNRRNDPRAA